MSPTGNAAIGLYLDEVPIVTQNPWQPGTYTGASEPHFFDMSRIEVLRGDISDDDRDDHQRRDRRGVGGEQQDRQ